MLNIKSILATIVLLALLLIAGVFVFAPAIVEQKFNQLEAHSPYLISEQARQLHQSLLIGMLTVCCGNGIDLSHSSDKMVQEVLELSQTPLLIRHTGFQGHCQSPRNISDQLMHDIATKGGLIAVGYWEAAVCGTSPKNVAESIKYGVKLLGEDHVALGSDYDGAVTVAFDSSELAVITDELLKIGLTEGQIRKVMGGNMLKFLQDNLP